MIGIEFTKLATAEGALAVVCAARAMRLERNEQVR